MSINDTFFGPRLTFKVLNERAAGDVLDFYLENPDFEQFEPERMPNFYTNEHMASTLRYEYEVIQKAMGLRLWVFETRSPFKIIGTVSFQNVLKTPYRSCQLGYKIHRAYRNRGFGTEAVTYACKRAFSFLDIHRIEAFTMPDNLHSINLLERVGFTPEGRARDKALIQGEWRDHLIYSLLSTDSV